ncbi:MAG: hypothetical protein PVJ83_01595, partial [Gammaproteobacteria bacterium]
MKKADIVLGTGAILAGALTVLYLLGPGKETPEPVAPPPVLEQAPAVEQSVDEQSPVRYPVAPPSAEQKSPDDETASAPPPDDEAGAGQEPEAVAEA